MNPQVVVPPARYPVSLAEARDQLNIDSEDFDARLAGLIAGATQAVEDWTGRALITRTYRAFLNWWPIDRQSNFVMRYVTLERAPLQGFASLKTYDDTDVATTMSAALYYVDTARTLGRVVLRRGAVWPIPLRVANGIELNWTAGYGDNSGDVPEPIRLAIKMMVGVFNEQRGDETAAPTMPPAAQAILSPYCVWPPA